MIFYVNYNLLREFLIKTFIKVSNLSSINSSTYNIFKYFIFPIINKRFESLSILHILQYIYTKFESNRTNFLVREILKPITTRNKKKKIEKYRLIYMRYIKKNNISHFLSLQKKRKKEINKEVSTKKKHRSKLAFRRRDGSSRGRKNSRNRIHLGTYLSGIRLLAIIPLYSQSHGRNCP